MSGNQILLRCRVALIASAIVAVASDASAQSAPSKTVANWDGFYVGASLGGAFNSTQFSQPAAALANISIGDRGASYGAYGGYNYSTASGIVLGAEAQWAYLGTGYFREFGPSQDFLQQMRYTASLSGRVGAMVGSNTLVYAKAGPALVNLIGNVGFTGTFNTTMPAAQLGFGVETLMTPNLGVRAEANFLQATQVLSLNSNRYRYRPDLLTFLVGLEYKFDAPARAGSTRPAPPPQSWTGFSIGGDVGINGDEMRYIDTAPGGLGETGPFAYPSLGAGVFFDADLQWTPVSVVGLELRAAFQHAPMQTADGSSGFAGTFYNYASMDNSFAASARVGLLATTDTLIYGRIGGAEIRVPLLSGYWNNFAPNATSDRYYPAVLTGVGFETFVAPKISVRLEADYLQTVDNILLNGQGGTNEFVLRPSNVSANMGLAVHF